MKADDFEQRLRKQTIRRIPDSWRDEILSACSHRREELEGLDTPGGLSASSPRRLPDEGAAKPATWWRELLWPCPQAWAALAAVWLTILAVHVFTPGASSEVVEARSPHVTAELLAAVNERRLLLAELMASSPAEPPKAIPPKRRSDRRVTLVAV